MKVNSNVEGKRNRSAMRSSMLLAGTSALVLAASAAQAGDVRLVYGTDFDFTGATMGDYSRATATANVAVNSLALNTGAVEALIIAGTLDIEGDEGSSQSSAVIQSNLLDATAIGNLMRTSMSLAGVVPSDGDEDAGGITEVTLGQGAGFGALSTAVNHGDAVVISRIADNEIAVSFDGSEASSLAISNNEMVATTRLNDSRTTVADVIDAEIVANVFEGSDAFGMVLFGDSSTFDPDTASNHVALRSQGTVAVGSSQLNTGDTIGGSQAVVEDNTLRVFLNEDADGDAENSSISVGGNALVADYTGNRAVTGVALGSETDIEGSIGVGNQQQNVFLRTVGDDEDRAAVNLGSLIEVDIADNLSSSVSVSSNTIGSSAAGNVALGSSDDPAGNYILIDADVNVTGNNTGNPGGGQGIVGLGDIGGVAGHPEGRRLAGFGSFVVGNEQSIVGAATTSITDDARIRVIVNDVEPSSVALEENSLYSTATGNEGDNLVAISANSVDATSVIASTQRIVAAPTDAVLGSERVVGGTFVETDTTAPISILNFGSSFNAPNATTYFLGDAAGDGSLIFDLSGVTDPNELNALVILLEDNLPGGSYDSVTGQFTFAYSTGDNVSLAFLGFPGGVIGTWGTFADGGASVSGDTEFSVTIFEEGSPAGASVIARILGDTVDSSVALDRNIFLAEADGNIVSNRIAIEANSIDGDGIGTGVSSLRSETGTAGDTVLSSVGDNSITSEQIVAEGADVSATAYGTVGIDTIVEDGGDLSAGLVESSGLSVSGNELRANARVNSGDNSISLLGTTIGTDNAATVAISSLQLSNVDAESLAELDVYAPIGVGNSAVDISNNRSVAVTAVNTVANRIEIDGVNVNGSADSAFLTFAMPDGLGGEGESLATASQVLQNVQVNLGEDASATANLLVRNVDDILEDGAGIASSAITAEGNIAQAIASGNRAANHAYVNGEAALTTSTGILSSQLNDQALDAVSNLVISMELSAEDGMVDSSMSLSGNGSIAGATANRADNQLVATGTSIDGPTSQLGSGFGLIGDLTFPGGTAGIEYLERLEASEFTADGTYAVANQQWSQEDVSASAGSFIGTGQESLDGLDSSSIAIDGNLTLAEASGNVSRPVSTNGEPAYTLRIDGTNIDVSGVAISRQSGSGDVTAEAGALLGAGIESGTGIAASSVSVSGNETAAYAVQNDATTSILVTGTSVAGTEVAPLAGWGSGEKEVAGFGENPEFEGAVGIADYALVATQESSGTISSFAGVFGGLLQLDGDIDASSVAVNGNFTEAGATANRARNSVSLVGTATMAATGAITSVQDSTSAVSAEVEMVLGAFSGGDDGGALGSSSVTVSDNIGIARARGNDAQNVLNAASSTALSPNTLATLGYAGAGSGLDSGYATGDGVSARADYMVLNAQTNTGAISANATGSALGLGNNGAVTGSSASIGGNVLATDAVGNTAINSMTATVRPSSSATTLAMVSYQRNAGDVSAHVNGASAGIYAGGSLSSSSTSVSGNRLSARAVGNSVVNSITRN